VVVEALDEQLATYAQPGLDGIVFTQDKGGPLYRGKLSEYWRDAVAKVPDAPEGLHIHYLRHHAATAMARMAGVTTKELMARLGHKSPRAALIYQHHTEERDRAIADYLDREIEAAKSASTTRQGASISRLHRA
jgi:integrase